MWVLIAIIAGVYILSKKKTVAVSSNAANTGGTSTPQPTKLIPPFYQQDNASTPAVPITELSFRNLKGTRHVPTVHNNLRLINDFQTPQRVRIPLGAIDNNVTTDFSSVGAEQEASYRLDLYANENPTLGYPLLVKPTTVNSASAVKSTAPYYSGNGAEPNVLAPSPLPNPTFEATVPVIAKALLEKSYVGYEQPAQERFIGVL